MYRTTKKYPVNNYVPEKVTDTNKDLHLKLKQMTYNDIVKDFDYHFENCYITNFDLINHECRGDKLNFSRRVFLSAMRKKFYCKKTDECKSIKF